MNTESLNEIPCIAIVLISCKQKSIEGIVKQLNEIDIVKETMLVSRRPMEHPCKIRVI